MHRSDTSRSQETREGRRFHPCQLGGQPRSRCHQVHLHPGTTQRDSRGLLAHVLHGESLSHSDAMRLQGRIRDREVFALLPEKPKAKEKYGPYTVTMKEKLDEPEIEDTDFSVMEIKCKEDTLKVKHCYMRYWVDNCAPVETEPILKLWRWVRKYHNDRPVVVHCSAGVGRTSTFVGMELASHRIASNPDTQMLDIVKELRKQRYQSIQSHVQFLYLHYLVLDYFVQEKIVESYKDSKFVEEYKRHTQKRTGRAKKQAAEQGKEKPDEDKAKSKNDKKKADGSEVE
ncbi:hypothetical protein PENTCL1PPCAC_11274 [Pristionchus entomophagus]|uniref:Tyrosine phosphatase n=1 Tax=Pristionchus entomophagus TaxID=358040 RepID=A0AAV5T628_9BILA|nr:hypothetical protein PENTCL1PPCAC_11274 [Pristionchus entomophagus]